MLLFKNVKSTFHLLLPNNSHQDVIMKGDHNIQELFLDQIFDQVSEKSNYKQSRLDAGRGFIPDLKQRVFWHGQLST